MTPPAMEQQTRQPSSADRVEAVLLSPAYRGASILLLTRKCRAKREVVVAACFALRDRGLPPEVWERDGIYARKAPASRVRRSPTAATAKAPKEPREPLRLSPEAQALAAHPDYRRFASVRAGKAHREYGVPLDDAEGAAFFGLCEAATRFDPGRGNKFLTYAGWWITRRLRQEYDQIRPKAGAGRRVAVLPFSSLGQDDRGALDVAAADAAPGESPDVAGDRLEDLLGLLEGEPARLCRLVFSPGGMTVPEAGGAIGAPAWLAWRLYREAMATLRAHLAARDIHRLGDIA